MEKAASYLNLRLEPRPNGTDMENYVLKYNTIAGVLFNSSLAVSLYHLYLLLQLIN